MLTTNKQWMVVRVGLTWCQECFRPAAAPPERREALLHTGEQA